MAREVAAALALDQSDVEAQLEALALSTTADADRVERLDGWRRRSAPAPSRRDPERRWASRASGPEGAPPRAHRNKVGGLSVASGMVLALLAAIAAAPDAERLLEAFQWKNRLLIVFAEPGGEALEAQRAAVEARLEGFRERDLVFLWLAQDRVVAGHEAEAESVPGARDLRARFHPEGSFTAVLVGKDGTEKLRSSEPVPMDRLFEVIDQMPMRQREMRER